MSAGLIRMWKTSERPPEAGEQRFQMARDDSVPLNSSVTETYDLLHFYIIFKLLTIKSGTSLFRPTSGLHGVLVQFFLLWNILFFFWCDILFIILICLGCEMTFPSWWNTQRLTYATVLMLHLLLAIEWLHKCPYFFDFELFYSS